MTYKIAKINQNGGTGDDRGWFIFAAIAAAVAAITAVGVGLGTHEEKSLLRENKEQTKLKDVYKIHLPANAKINKPRKSNETDP